MVSSAITLAFTLRAASAARLTDGGDTPLCCSCPVAVGHHDQRKLCESMCVDGVSSCNHGEVVHCVAVPCEDQEAASANVAAEQTDEYLKASEVCLFRDAPREAYFWDPSCASGGIGCNADGRSHSCRFCGTHARGPACPPQEEAVMPTDALPCYGLIHPSICAISDRCYWDKVLDVCTARCEDPGNQHERLCTNGGAGPCMWSGNRCRSSYSCVSTPDWLSSDGNTCQEYQEKDWCRPDGSYGANWGTTWGWFRNYAVNGTGALEACCACGGGQQV